MNRFMNMRFNPDCLFAVILVVSLISGGCRSKQSGQSQSTYGSHGTTYTYHLRGIVKALPQRDQLPMSLSIKTEAISRWVGVDGKIEPMMAMTMPYQLAHGVALQGIAVGDKVAFTYQVNWTADRMVITQIYPLPAATILNFSMPTATSSATTKPAKGVMAMP